MFTEEQSKAILSDLVMIYNKIDADLNNIRDKQQLLANLIQGLSTILNTEESTEEAKASPKK